MKILFSLSIAIAFAFSTSAQTVHSGNIANAHKEPVSNHSFVTSTDYIPVHYQFSNKATAAPTRWYVPWDIYNLLNADDLANNIAAVPIFFDSTVRQRFSTGLDAINYLSAAQVIDPISTDDFFNEPVHFAGEIKVDLSNSYLIDSVFFSGVYVESATAPGGTSVVDTLILAVSTSTQGYHYWTPSTGAWISNYCVNDTLKGFAPVDVDSINRAVSHTTNGSNPGNSKVWKIPLTANDRTLADPTTGALTLKYFVLPVPGGGVQANAGQRINMSVTFKSGDTWQKNVDSFNHLHNFRLVSSFIASGNRMKYYYPTLGDRNGSALMFSTDTSYYAPAISIEGTSTADFSYEYHQMGAHVFCSKCFISVNNINKQIKETNAYPNPANSIVKIPFTLATAADVSFTLSNAIGQVVKEQTLRNTVKGEASFNTSDFAAGIYTYTIETMGERLTGRFIVYH